jgi:excisionase family DNA binding protein
MFPTMRPIPTNQNQGTNRNASANTIPLSEQVSPPVLVACFILPSEQVETIISILQGLAANSSNGSQINIAQAAPTQEQSPAWLTHSEAARYLGVAISTLYRYAEQGRIECRKLGNRLEYRRSSLDRFKENQIRPPRRARSRGIITSTLGSGN